MSQPETKLVIVMRTDLQMRKGKMIAQGSHATMRAIQGDNPALTQWLDDPVRTTICVRVDTEAELLAICYKARCADIPEHPMVDAGRTEFGGVQTLTCAAIGPARVEDIDQVTGGLVLL